MKSEKWGVWNNEECEAEEHQEWEVITEYQASAWEVSGAERSEQWAMKSYV